MSTINRLLKAPVADVSVNDSQKADSFRQKVIQRNMESDGEAQLSATTAFKNGQVDQYKNAVDRVIGDGDSYVSIVHIDLAIGPGFCHCECQCEA